MKVLVVGANVEELPEAAEFAGAVYVDSPAEYRDDPDLVLLRVRTEADLALIGQARNRFGKASLLVALTGEREDPMQQELLQAGADDCCRLGDELTRRLPFLFLRITSVEARERRLQNILETTVDGIIVIDTKGCIHAFNAAAERIFGYRSDEVVGKNVGMLMPEPYREEHDEYIGNYMDTGLRKVIGIGREVVGRRSDGSVFPMELSVSEVRIDGGSTFTGLVRDISERRRLENEVLRISDQERRRIGQDLHDGLGQTLTGIGLIAQNLGRRMRGMSEDIPREIADEVDEVTDLIREADQQARSLARGLVPVELDVHGLAAALQRLCTNAGRLFGVECTFEEIGSTPVRESTAAINLYRIAQEAVSNAVKHGGAASVRVTLASGREQVRLRIQDNGVGFPERLSEDRGMGVRIMHYRARVIGGVLEIRRIPEGGTLVTCTLPRISNPALRAASSSTINPAGT